MLYKAITAITTTFYIIFGITLDSSASLLKLNIPFPIMETDNGSIATLEIPSISLKQELYDKNDVRNNLNEHIIFLPSSSTPDKDKGNVIIAGHNGLTNAAYFKNLHRLKLGDMISLTYYGKSYTYKVVDMYKVAKTGQVEVIRDSNKRTITLITCSGNKDQLVVIGEQKK